MPANSAAPGGAAPADLARLQAWFGRAVSRHLLEGNATNPAGIEGAWLADEAGARVRAANGVDGLERVAIYNRQYWFRLIDCMQREYPCGVHVLGLDPFNLWVIRYLEAHPSRSPYLADLDAGFADFVAARHQGRDPEMVIEALRYDRAFSRTFDAPPGRPLRLQGLEQARLQLSPTCVPLWLHWDFQAYRSLCRADAALTAVLPLAAKEHGVVVYRQDQGVHEKPVSHAAFLLLDALRTPCTLADLFASLEPRLSRAAGEEIAGHLTEWFRVWVERGWLCAADGSVDTAESFGTI